MFVLTNPFYISSIKTGTKENQSRTNPRRTMNNAKYFLVFAMVASLGACRTTRFIPPETSDHFPAGALVPTHVDPVQGPRKQYEPTVGEIETPGPKDLVEVRDTLQLVDALPDSIYALYVLGTDTIVLFKNWVRMGPDKKKGVLVDEGGFNIGLLRLEFDTLGFNDSELRYSRVDSLNKRGNFLSKLILRYPGILWVTRDGQNIPTISSYEIDTVEHTNAEYLLVPRVKGGTGDPIRLHRAPQRGLVSGISYEPDLASCKPFKQDEKGRMFYGGRKLKKKSPFYVVIGVSGKEYEKAKGAKKQKHDQRDRKLKKKKERNPEHEF